MNPRAGASPLRAEGFDGLRVLSLESRRAAEIERLIRSQSGVPFVAPSMREVPLEHNSLALDFAARMLGQSAAGGDFSLERAGASPLCAVEPFDMVVFLTGVGARLLNQISETRYPPGAFIAALHRVAVVVRGSKPAAVMREWGVRVAVTVPEPNTWREILAATEGRQERRIAVQEYGRPATELVAGLRARGAEVTTVPVYQWDLPEDPGLLKEAARRTAKGEFDVILFTTSVQIQHFMKIAAEENLAAQLVAAFPRMVVASVGPSTSEALREFGVEPDLEPSHPKMGFLVNETARRAREILQSKQ
jgi:uroporphyrinogen-III synthase